MKTKFNWQFILIPLLFLCMPKLALAGHLFTQASANTPTWIQQGTGIQIDQESMEGPGGSGDISIDFAANSTIPDGADTSTDDWWQWSTGDVLRFSVPTSGDNSLTATIAYDNPDGCSYDICGVTGSTGFDTSAMSGIISTTNLQQSHTEVSQASPLVWTVEALAGEFSLAGFRIYFANGTINGTGAGTLNQNSVVDSGDLPSATPDIDSQQTFYTVDDINQGNVTTVFDGGTLQVTGPGDITADFVINGTNGTVDTSDNSTELSGTLSGDGKLIKSGDGTLTLSGDSNSHSGGVEITGGILQVASDASLGASAGQITLNGGALETTSDLTSQRPVFLNANGGEIKVNDDTQTTLNGTITGTGTLTKSGNGTLVLGGDSTFTNPTEVNEGTLFVDGTLSSTTTTVASSARLAGSGSIGGDVSVNGVLAPGDSPGTLTVAGDVTLSSGSTFEVDLDGSTYNAAGGAGTYDRVVITGATSVFTAAGTITPKLRGISGAANNTFTPQFGDNFRVVTTVNPNGITGTFSAINSPVSGLAANSRFDLVYGVNAIDLFVTPASYATLITANGKGNAIRFASALDQLRPSAVASSGANTELFNSLYKLSAQELYRTTQHASGELHAIALDATRSGLKELSSALSNTTQSMFQRERRHSTGQNLWLDVGGGRRIIDSDSQASGYSNSSNYLWVGHHLINSQQQTAGIALGHSTSTKINSASGDASYDTTTLAGYYLRAWNNVDLDLAAGIAHSLIDVTRTTPFSSDNARNSSSAMSQATFINLGLGYNMPVTADITGRIWTRLNAEIIRAKRYKERGDTRTALKVKKQHDNSSSISVGYQLNGSFRTKTQWDVGLGVTRKNNNAIDREVALQDTYWKTSAPQEQRTAPFIYGGVSYDISRSTRLALDAKATQASGQPDRSVNLTFSTRW